MTTQTAAPALSIQNVVLDIGAVKILRDISVSVDAGAAVGLIGANGSGKSSLLNVISGYYRPTSGDVSVNGRSATSLRPDQVCALGVGRSFQSIGRMQDLSVRDYVLLGLEPTWREPKIASLFGIGGVVRAERAAKAKADAFIADFDLAPYRDTLLKNCPYGVRKVADLLRAFGCEPSVLLLDEPTSGVAASDRQTIADLIAHWQNRSNCALVLVDHDVSFVAQLVDSMVALSAGQVVDAGPSDAVLSNPRVLATFIGESD